MNSDNIISDSRGLYVLYTLIDITDTQITDTRISQSKEYNQSQNLNVLLQVIGLRCQPINYKVTELKKENMTSYTFGSKYKSLQTVWKLEFEVDREDVWKKDDDDVFYLKEDINEIVITTDLNETCKIKTACFDSFSFEFKNITFNKM
jgi:hypothetical protein